VGARRAQAFGGKQGIIWKERKQGLEEKGEVTKCESKVRTVEVSSKRG
jgi:hypothetical protein